LSTAPARDTLVFTPPGNQLSQEQTGQGQHTFDRAHLSQFYTQDRINARAAKGAFVEPLVSAIMPDGTLHQIFGIGDNESASSTGAEYLEMAGIHSTGHWSFRLPFDSFGFLGQ